MIFLAFLAVAVIVWLLSIKVSMSSIQTTVKEKNLDVWAETPAFWKTMAIPALILLFGLFNPFRVERVDAGHVGIKVNLTGDNRGVSKYEYRTGWVLYNSWVSKLYEFPTYQQHIDYDEQTVITRGGMTAIIKPSFNYSLKAGDVGDMFQNLRIGIKDIEQQWLRTAIVGTVNDVANKWAVDSIFNSREQFESNIVSEANKRTSRWFQISQLRTNILPPKALEEAILAKTKAYQDVQVAENQKLVAVAVMDRKIAEAKGDSSQKVINAKASAEAMREEAAGEADAIKLRQQQLTPQYVEYFKISKWDGALPQVQGTGSGILMNLNKPDKN